MKRPLVTRFGLLLIGLIARLVPEERRADWRLEWEAEVLHRSGHLSGGRQTTMRVKDQLDLLGRIGGALPDAAWVRRQLGTDADLWHDLRHGARRLWRDRSFAVPAVVVLALGLGSATALYTLADGLLLRPLPYPDPERVVTLWQVRGEHGERQHVAPANFLDWRERSSSLTQMAAAIPYSYDHTGGGEPEVFFAAQVTEGFFDAFGVRPLAGRLFRADEHLRGKHQVCLVGELLWRHRFGADPRLVGRVLPLDGEPYEVVGILPASFDPGFQSSSAGRRDLWTPHVVADHERRTRASAWWSAVARLAPGASLASAQAELDAISASLAQEHPRTNRNLRVALLGLRDHLTGGVRPALSLMLAAVGLLVAIVWANVAGLLLARGVQRERELAIRASLGAGRGRLLRQLLAETLLVTALGAGLAWGLARLELRALVALSPVDVPRLHEVRLDGAALAFLAALALSTTLACGLPPALRLSAQRLEGALREGVRAGARRLRSGLRGALVVAEVALALLLLVGAGLVTRSLERLLGVDPGFHAKGVATLQVFAWDRNRTPERIARFFDETLARMRALPGVTSAGAVSRMPFIEANLDIKGPLSVVGDPPREAGQEPSVSLAVATPGYFETLRIPLLEGRLFAEDDRRGSAPVLLVNETLARRHLPQGALGRTLALQWQGRPLSGEVVGVVGGVHQERLDGAPEPEVFFPLAQVPFASMSYVLRSDAAPATLIEPAKRAVWAIDPLQTFYRTASVEELVHKTVADRRFLMAVLAAFAGLALLLTASGLYGLVSVLAAERTREFGVRVALGAREGQILGMVLAQGLRLVLPGIGLGLAGALAATGALRGVLYGISPHDPATLGIVCATLVAVAVVACLGPARRALAVDPTLALRGD